MNELVFGRCRHFRRFLEQLDSYAKHDWPALLLGETGTGKELLAQRIHQRSPRKNQKFVSLNCGAIPSGLIESELFGHEKGSFTGAVQSTKGLIREAHGGTLFLDEIGDMDLKAQVKLLRLLDSGEVRSVGSAQTGSVNVRIIAATNVDLYYAAQQGTFRMDLLERLAVLPLRVPALRSRRDDIRILAAHFALQLGRTIDPRTFEALETYHWPRNIRQLRNLIVRATILTPSEIGPNVISKLLADEDSETRLQIPSIIGPNATGQNTMSSNAIGTLDDIEKQIIVNRLRECNGNRKETAKTLGIGKSTLHEKLKRWKQETADHPYLDVPFNLSVASNA